MSRKKFNTTGVCVPEKHYMADISAKLDATLAMVEEGAYFVINRPRQYGKTTLLSLLAQHMREQKAMIPLFISFEGISSESYRDEPRFLRALMAQFRQVFRLNPPQIDALQMIERGTELTSFAELSEWISALVTTSSRPLVLIIDEVDHSSNYQLFIDFLAVLRTKYLAAASGRDVTFHSVILAGVHDVKSLKLRLRPDEERHYNSPWNIAADFALDLGLSPCEIQTMLADYGAATGVEMDPTQMAEQLWQYTSGYPFLVSALCKILDEDLKPPRWLPEHVDEAVNRLLGQTNTNFDHLIKHLQEDRALFDLIEQLVVHGEQIEFHQYAPPIAVGALHGILTNDQGMVRIHNRIYQEHIYNYLATTLKLERLRASHLSDYTFPAQFLLPNQRLDIERILLKFQEFMRQEYSQRDAEFLERHGRLVFFAFLRPILNGRGFAFKEPQISEEKRLDVAITFGAQREIIELKRWRGEEAHQRGLRQLADYLECTGHERGALVIFDLTQKSQRRWQQEHIEVDGKTIFAVWV